MTNPRRFRLLPVVLATVAVFALGGMLAGCSSDTSSSSASPSIAVTADTTLIDVRTPGEFTSGHLQGARNIDIQSSSFSQQIAELDKNANYVVYCRSGNRSAAAVAAMQAAGFTNVQDAGGLSEASGATGVAIVT